MKIKKEVYKKILEKLQEEHTKINAKIQRNLYTFKALQKEQTILKRERAELGKLISEYEVKSAQ